MSLAELLLYPACILIGLLFRSYLPSYFKKKGENLATKEDIAEITEKIESVKAEISQRLQLSQFRYQKEFEILLDLSAKVVDLRDATISLRPAVDHATDSPEERKRTRYSKWLEEFGAFYYSTERTRPFYPEEIFKAVKELETTCHVESNRYKTYSGDPEDRHYDPKYWEEASQNAEKIKAQANVVLEHIRYRTQEWELL